MARFTGIPSLPQSGVEEWNLRTLNALKQNVELLTGTRGENDLASKALLKSQLTVNPAPLPTLTSVTPTSISINIGDFRAFTAAGAMINPNSVSVINTNSTTWTSILGAVSNAATLQDVQRLTNDVAQLRAVVNTLIQQLKA